MIKVALDIRFLHIGLARPYPVKGALGGIGKGQLNRLISIDPSKNTFDFHLLVEGQRYSMIELLRALPDYNNYIKLPYRLYSLPIFNQHVRNVVRELQDRWYRKKVASLKPEIVQTFEDLWAIPLKNESIPYKTVVSVHSHIDQKFKDEKKRKTFIERLKKADHVITVSNDVRNELINNHNLYPSKITTIYNGVDKRVYRSISKSEKEVFLRRFGITENYFIYVGSWGEIKNIPTLIKAFNVYKERYKRADQLVLVGNIEKYNKYQTQIVKGLINNSKFSDDIISVGYMLDEELALMDNYAQAMIHLAYYEGFSQSVAEAMACGTPVIASKEVAVAKELGLADELIEPDDADLVAERMNKIVTDECYKKTLIERQNKVVDQLSWKKSAYQLLSLYEQIVNES